MTSTTDAGAFQTTMRRLEELLRESERSTDPASRVRIREVVSAVLKLHAAGLDRILELLSGVETGNGADLIDTLAADELVSGLLLLHGLHPQTLEDRVDEALEQVRPRLRSRGGSVELLGVVEGTVRLRLGGTAARGPSSGAVQRMVEETLLSRLPDVVAVEFEGVEEHVSESNGRARVALPLL